MNDKYLRMIELYRSFTDIEDDLDFSDKALKEMYDYDNKEINHSIDIILNFVKKVLAYEVKDVLPKKKRLECNLTQGALDLKREFVNYGFNLAIDEIIIKLAGSEEGK